MNDILSHPAVTYARELINKYIELRYYRRARRFAEALQRVLDKERVKRGEQPLWSRY
jgi:adenine-specific DNA glycosylase